MTMKLVELKRNDRPKTYQLAYEQIMSGGLVIAMADTSYAILSLLNNPTAQKKMAEIKKDRKNKQYSIFVPNRNYITDRIENPVVRSRIKRLLPGALTVVTSNDEPGMRYISRLTINRIIALVKEPLTATSANPSGKDPARNLTTICKYFGDYNILVLYELPVPKMPPSTIIDVSQSNIKILRQGSVVIE
jgi:L-threonylcarbamoyladenylate synthase